MSDTIWTESFHFKLGSKAFIREISRVGTVEAITVDYLGVQYRIAYWTMPSGKRFG